MSLPQIQAKRQFILGQIAFNSKGTPGLSLGYRAQNVYMIAFSRVVLVDVMIVRLRRAWTFMPTISQSEVLATFLQETSEKRS